MRQLALRVHCHLVKRSARPPWVEVELLPQQSQSLPISSCPGYEGKSGRVLERDAYQVKRSSVADVWAIQMPNHSHFDPEYPSNGPSSGEG